MFELAPGSVRIALDSADSAKRQIAELSGKVNRAKHPDAILTDSVAMLGTGAIHCDLAPFVAAERWEKVLEAYAYCESLSERWHDLEGEAEAIRVNAVQKGAEAIRTGKKAPSVAAAILDAETALESCSLVLTESVADLRKARSAYDAIWRDRAFLIKYRDAVVADFTKQRAKVVDAYNVATGAIGETRRRYATLHALTVDDLGAIPEDDIPYVRLAGRGWAQADLSAALGVIGRQVNEDDPILSGDFLAMPLKELSEAAEAVVREFKEKERENAQNHFSPQGITSSRLI